MPSIRLLDVGCGDGSIGTWVCEQLRDQGHDVTYVGVDLDEKMAAAAAERLQQAGIDGYTQAGDAYDAPRGPFDAILCFELIEHVEDPDRLLAELERRLAPGGRIYLSTPNGTFGTGNNPHHLRVYDLEGLLDVLRRRGRLSDALAGGDGVAVAAYTPAPRRGDVAIYCGPGWEKWAPWDIETRGLGGSETAAVRVGEQLSALGYVVTVYADVERTMVGEDGLLFEHFTAFDPTTPRRAVISSRMPDLFDRRLRTDRRILWLHDVDCGDRLTPTRADRIDAIMVLSGWHERHVLQRYPWLAASKVRRTRNGIHVPYFEGVTVAWEDRPRRAAYTSSPDRGADFLLDVWPLVRERLPDAELVMTYAPVYEKVAERDPTVRAHRDGLERAARQPGVRRLPGLGQPELARLLGSSRAWLAPSWMGAFDAPFFETFCIGAVEAAAAGAVRVGSPWGALLERGLDVYVSVVSQWTVGIPGEAERPDPEAWVDAIVAALTGDEPAGDAREHALTQSWAQVAVDFARVIDPDIEFAEPGVDVPSALAGASIG